MSQEAKWVNGESILSQTHSTGNIEPAYADGESGRVPFDEYMASGTAYQRFISDNAGIADGLARAFSAVRRQGDAVGVTDAVTAATFRVIAYALAEAVGVTDSIRRAMGFGRAIADQAGLADGLARAFSAVRRQGDAVGVADAVTRAASIIRRITEQAGVTDFSARYASISRVVSEAVGVADPMEDTERFSRALMEALGISDAMVATYAGQSIAHVRMIAEAIGVTDSFSFSVLLNVWLAIAMGILSSPRGVTPVPGPTVEVSIVRHETAIDPGSKAPRITLGVQP